MSDPTLDLDLDTTASDERQAPAAPAVRDHPTRMQRDLVLQFIKDAGFNPSDVAELIISPRQVVATLYVRENGGSGRIVTRGRGVPATQVVTLAVG